MAERDGQAGSETSGQVVIPCDTYSRVVGYLRPVSSWNVAKVHEFGVRAEYDALAALDSARVRAVREEMRARADGEIPMIVEANVPMLVLG